MRISLHFIRDLSDERGKREVGGEDARSNFHGQRIILRGSRRIFVLDRHYVPRIVLRTLREISRHSGTGDPRPPRRSPPLKGRTSLPRCHDLTLTYSAYYQLADTERSCIGLPEFRLAQRRYLIDILGYSTSRDIQCPTRFPFLLLIRDIILVSDEVGWETRCVVEKHLLLLSNSVIKIEKKALPETFFDAI